MTKVMVGMSGGVDSSAAALLLQRQGYTCVGATLRLYNNDTIGQPQGQTCCSLDDVEDARAVCDRMGIPHYVFNFQDEFEEKVICHFISEYEAGRTPNPCIDCNKNLKFGKMLQRARELGCEYIATGHYARIEQGEDGRWKLLKGSDLTKDQSYVLYNMTQDQLAHTLFPLGNMTKAEIRQTAAAEGFVNARKPDSQDICFVPDGDYVAFMKRHTGHNYPAGNFVDENGKILGRHRGAVRYTLGQRKGLGLSLSAPAYVIAKDMTANTVTIGAESSVFKSELTADNFNWIIAPPAVGETLHCCAMPRYRKKEQPAAVTRLEDGSVRIVFDAPQRAPTPGQAVVLYNGDEVLGGGTIR